MSQKRQKYQICYQMRFKSQNGPKPVFGQGSTYNSHPEPLVSCPIPLPHTPHSQRIWCLELGAFTRLCGYKFSLMPLASFY